MRSMGHWTLRGGLLVLGLAVLALGALAGPVGPPVAQAAPGDNLTSFDASVTAGIPPCSSGIGTGIAYDGASLILSCWGSNVLERVDAVTHLNNGPITVSGLPQGNDLGALAWDAGRGKLWACNGGTVVLIDLGAAAVDVTQPAIPTSGCIDGLAYDGTDDTLWASCDVCDTVYHYDLPGGGLIGSFPVGGLIGSCGNSGIAVGGPKLYLANNGCSEIYQVEKNFSSSSFFADFLPFRLEDLECDDRTFAPLDAIWSQDAYDRILNAWELPAGPELECTAGGGGENPTIKKDPELANLWLCNIAGAPGCDNKGSGVEEVNFDVRLNSPVTSPDPKCLKTAPDPEDCPRQTIGAFEFQVRYDSKLLIVDWEPGELAALMECGKIRQENALQIACVTKGKPEAPSGPGVLATLRVRATADVYSILIANQENGIATQLINQDCQLSDLQGHPIKTDVCGDAAITIRYLEGDIHADCAVDVTDQQQIAFRWGSRLGNLLYNSRMDLEPSQPKKGDGDIDAKDLQFVYGRHGSTCKSPWPAQDPVDPKAKPTPIDGER